MLRRLFMLITLISTSALAQQALVSKGSIRHIEGFKSNYVPPRNVDIWLPAGYDSTQKYAVLYMHDGTALFDASIMWNKQEWQVDENMAKLLDDKKIRNCIVVGIWNGNANRHSEYFPQKPFELLSKRQQDSLYQISAGNGKLFAGKISSDAYLKFIVKELKPYVDAHYPTLRNQPNTFIAGSSMGGLMSLYAICQYPKVFGGAACLSTHWPGTFALEANPIPAAFISYFGKHLPSPKNHKIYFDHGDQTLDALYAPYQQQMDALMQANGYSAGNFQSKVFPGADHSENSWSKRLDIPLVFLLGK